MFEPSALFDLLDRRARLVRGLRYAGISSASIAAVALLVAALSAAIRSPIDYFIIMAASGVVVFAAAGFALGVRLPFARSVILMRADVALGFEASLSTLNDIQNKPEMMLFSQRIKSRLPDELPLPSAAFPIRWHEAGFIVGAVAMLCAAIVIAIIPIRSRQAQLRAEIAIEAVMEQSGSQPAVESAPDAVSETQANVDSPVSDSSSDPTETLTLGDILSSIRSTPATPTDANAEIDSATLRPRETRNLSLEQVLRQIEARLLEDGSQSLTALETEALEAHQETTQGEIADRLQSLLESSSTGEILEQIAQVLADPELADAVRGSELPTDEQGSTQAARVAPDVDADTPPLMLEPAADSEGQLVFVETILPSESGDEGDYTYYLTKGVPIEPPSEPAELSYQDLDLSYEQLDSIASSRSLDPDVLDTIKAYFDRIARGGS